MEPMGIEPNPIPVRGGFATLVHATPCFLPHLRQKKKRSVGIEPTTFGLKIQCSA